MEVTVRRDKNEKYTPELFHFSIVFYFLSIALIPSALRAENKVERVKLTVKKSSRDPNSGDVSQEALERMMLKAKTFMTNREYQKAVVSYEKVLAYPKNKYSIKALEFLGLAWEKHGKLAHARAQYKKYLRLYPKGEGADRVRQRLAGVETAQAKPRKRLRKARKKRKTARIYGSFAEFYNFDSTYNERRGTTNNISSFTSNLHLVYRDSTDSYNIRSLLIGGYDYDFLDKSDSSPNLSRLYLYLSKKDQKASIRIGRQQNSSGGVLGRFDGVLMNLRLNKYVKANLVSGLPVSSIDMDTYKTNKYFYGLNFDFGTLNRSWNFGTLGKGWNFNTFLIKQMVDGITDRQALGGEFRYYDNDTSIFTFLDYDFYFGQVNTFIFTGSYTLSTETRLNVSVDYRKSPTLTISNAVIGQNVDSPKDMLDNMNKGEVRELAKDRTATSKSLLFGIVQPINKALQISGDITVSEITGTKASGGVEEVQGTGRDYFYNVQLTGNSLIVDGDIAILGLRHFATKNSDTSSVILNTRYPYSRDFRINPRIRVDFQKKTMRTEEEDRLRIRPSVRLDYRWIKSTWLELIAGVEWDRNLDDGSDTDTSYFCSVGYRLSF